MSEHIENRKKIKAIPDIKTFDNLLDQSTLSDLDKEILRLHYLKHQDLQMIGDSLGYSTITIKRRHSKALSKIVKLL